VRLLAAESVYEKLSPLTAERAMRLKFLIYKTNNNVKASPDVDRLIGLARRFADKEMPGSGSQPEIVARLVTRFTKEWEDSKVLGVCGGMIAEWAWEYFVTGDPLARPNEAAIERTQARQEMTYFKRKWMEKAHQGSTAQSRMYADVGLALTKVIRHNPLPLSTKDFQRATIQISMQLAEGVPFLLSVSPTGGRHALGLTVHQGSYYVLEPNQGMFRFPTEAVFVEELGNYFIQKLIPGSIWRLKRIDSLYQTPDQLTRSVGAS
jgi:hypothetical protein